MSKLVSLRSTHLMRVMETIFNELEPDLPIEALPDICQTDPYLERLNEILESFLGHSEEVDDLAIDLWEDGCFEPYTRSSIINIYPMDIYGLIIMEIEHVTIRVPEAPHIGRNKGTIHNWYRSTR